MKCLTHKHTHTFIYYTYIGVHALKRKEKQHDDVNVVYCVLLK